MNRIIPAGCLAALFLAGCNFPSQHTPVTRNYGAASDVAVTVHDPAHSVHIMGQRCVFRPTSGFNGVSSSDS